MNTITNLQMNNSNNITSFKGFGIKGLKSFKSATQIENKLPQELKGLEQKYFKEYSLMDKFLIKLNLKKDNSAEMAVFDSLGMEPIYSKGKILWQKNYQKKLYVLYQ